MGTDVQPSSSLSFFYYTFVSPLLGLGVGSTHLPFFFPFAGDFAFLAAVFPFEGGGFVVGCFLLAALGFLTGLAFLFGGRPRGLGGKIASFFGPFLGETHPRLNAIDILCVPCCHGLRPLA